MPDLTGAPILSFVQFPERRTSGNAPRYTASCWSLSFFFCTATAWNSLGSFLSSAWCKKKSGFAKRHMLFWTSLNTCNYNKVIFPLPSPRYKTSKAAAAVPMRFRNLKTEIEAIVKLPGFEKLKKSKETLFRKEKAPPSNVLSGSLCYLNPSFCRLNSLCGRVD